MTARSTSTSSRRLPATLVRPIGMLLDDQEPDHTRAFNGAFDLVD